MEILKTATEWAKAEVFSSRFFIFFGILFVIAAVGFWKLGVTEMARSFIIPMLVAGSLILAVGLGIYFTNKSRISSFETAYKEDPEAFVRSEIQRTEQTMGEFKTIVFKVIPFIIVAASILIVFMDKPLWRAIGITTIAMMVIIILVDTNADARVKAYHEQLLVAGNQAGH